MGKYQFSPCKIRLLLASSKIDIDVDSSEAQSVTLPDAPPAEDEHSKALEDKNVEIYIKYDMIRPQ